MEVCGKTYRTLAFKTIVEQDDPRPPVEEKNPVGAPHLEVRIKRVSHDDVRVEVALIDEASPDYGAALRWNRAIEILPIRERTAVFETHRVRERAVEPVKSHVHIAEHRRS